MLDDVHLHRLRVIDPLVVDPRAGEEVDVLPSDLAIVRPPRLRRRRSDEIPRDQQALALECLDGLGPTLQGAAVRVEQAKKLAANR